MFDIERPPKEMMETLKGMYTGLVQDACDEVLGIHVRTWMDARLRPIYDDAVVVGPAVTVQMVPPSFESAKARNGLKLAFEAVDHAQAGDVIVVGGELIDSGMWGEMMAIAGKRKGLNGAIVDGGVRDVLAIQEMKFPLFYTNPVVTSAQPRLETVAVNEPVECGGRVVRPGDLVVADYDGVVVVPKDAIEKIYSLCLEYAEKEKGQREALESGTPLTDLMKAIL